MPERPTVIYFSMTTAHFLTTEVSENTLAANHQTELEHPEKPCELPGGGAGRGEGEGER